MRRASWMPYLPGFGSYGGPGSYVTNGGDRVFFVLDKVNRRRKFPTYTYKEDRREKAVSSGER